MLDKIEIFFKNPKFAIATNILILLSAFIIDYFKDIVGTEHLLMSAILVMIIIFFSLYIHQLYSNEEVNEQVQILKDFFASQGLDSIVSENKLSKIEQNAKDIWIVSMDLANDIGEEQVNKIDLSIFNTVVNNLKNNKNYIYFVSSSVAKKGHIHKYRKVHKDYLSKNQVKFCIVPDNRFHFTSEIAIYDIDMKDSTAVQFFPNKELNYYLAIDEYHTMHITGVLNSLVKQYGLIDILDYKYEYSFLL